MSSWHHGRGALEWEDPDAFYDSREVDSRIRGQLILTMLQNLTTLTGSASIAGNPVKFHLDSTAANLFVAAGGASRDVFQWTNGSTIWAAETAGLAADPTDIIEFLGAIFVAQGEANNVRRKASGSWGAGTSGFPAVFFATAGNVLYWCDNINEIYFSVADPTAAAANRQGPIYVGDTNTYIRALRVWDNRLYIGKDDGLYVLQDGRVLKLLDFSFARDANNFRWMKDWQGALYFPILGGLYRLIAGVTLQAVGPNRGAAGELELVNIATERDQRTFKSLATTRTGQIVDIVPTDSFLYAVVDGLSGTSQILAFNGVGWHQVVEGAAANTRIRAAFFTSVLASAGSLSIPRLWYGYGTNAYNVMLPDGTDDPYEYSSETYVVDGNLDSPWFTAHLPGVHKEWHDVTMESENFSSTETVQVSYELDDLGAYQNLVDSSGTAYPHTFSPSQTIAFPVRTVSRRIRLRFSLARGSTATETPKVKRVIVRYLVRPDTRYAWQLRLRAGRAIYNPYLRLRERADSAEVRQRLERARDSRSRLTFDDGDLEPGITNRVLNPEFRLDSNSDGLADSWVELGTPTTSLDVTRKQYGLRSQQTVTGASGQEGVETAAITVVVGTRYTASVYLFHRAGDALSLGVSATSGGTFIASVRQTAITTDFVRLEVTFVATGTTVYLRVARESTDAAAATTYNISAAQLEITPDDRYAVYELMATSFASGEQPRCSWSGAPHASVATRPGTAQVFVTNIGETEIKRPSIAEWIRGVGSEYAVTVTVAEVA